MKSESRLRQILAHRSIYLLAPVLGVLPFVASLNDGYDFDDYVQRYRVLHLFGPLGTMENLGNTLLRYFEFCDDPYRDYFQSKGFFPWWADKDWQVSFFRPVSSLTHWLDFTLWPDAVWAMHLQSLGWYALAVYAATRLYRRLLGSGATAGLAAVLFALDDSHLYPASWIANRNILIALVFGLVCLYGHDRWRTGGERRFALPALSAFGLSLLSAEGGIATFAYVLAHAVCLDRGPWVARIRILSTYAILGLGYHLLLHALGFGSWNNSIYVDPIHQPLDFIRNLILRGPYFLSGTLGFLDPALSLVTSVAARNFLWWVIAAILALMTWVLFPLLETNRQARFFTLGMLISLVPLGALNLSNNRVLLFPSLGGMALVALFLGEVFGQRGGFANQRRFRRGLSWTVAMACFLSHAVVAPALSLKETLVRPMRRVIQEQLVDGLVREVEPGRDMILLNAPSTFFCIYTPMVSAYLGGPGSEDFNILGPGQGGVEIERLDARTLRISPSPGFCPPAGSFHPDSPDLDPPFHLGYVVQCIDRGLWNPGRRMEVGERVNTTKLEIEVTRVLADGSPAEAKVRFALPLESPVYKWLAWDWKTAHYERFELPAVGATAVLPGLIETHGVWADFFTPVPSG